MSGFNIERLIKLNTLSEDFHGGEIFPLSLPTGKSIDLDIESYCYYYNDYFGSGDILNTSFNKDCLVNSDYLAGIHQWVNYNSNEIMESQRNGDGYNENKCKQMVKDEDIKENIDILGIKNKSNDNMLPTLLSYPRVFHNEKAKIEGVVVSCVKAIVLFLRANLGSEISKIFKKEVESLGTYIVEVTTCSKLLQIFDELDGCRRLIVTSADAALNENLTESLNKKKYRNFLGITLYCGPHADYHVKWCSKVPCIKFLSQNLIEVRRAISWILAESVSNLTETTLSTSKKSKKITTNSNKKILAAKAFPSLVGDFPSLNAVKSVNNENKCLFNTSQLENHQIHYSPLGVGKCNSDIITMLRNIAISTALENQSKCNEL
ncbi:hypothetical protein cand_000530 [Cryptosporidium andersoni]|uniref:Uncharacterized protein n=1 Tax=Cryptosporidium andersoni TaxID=117008 RepID=A0A1J4MU41_9CRYT|nr:hypothetical protein cand_000530 [Cryptosporidium andersoni]